tara:strand:+ start:681 stop:1007 length:327 start_codon:yes stop_codon:yes gene_type:complete
MNTKFTKGEWVSDFFIVKNLKGKTIADCGFSDELYDTEEEANVHLIAAAPDMYKMLGSLLHELSMAIDEVNTMRDIHHKDNLTPADHWDKESLHDAQILLAKARGEIT